MSHPEEGKAKFFDVATGVKSRTAIVEGLLAYKRAVEHKI